MTENNTVQTDKNKKVGIVDEWEEKLGIKITDPNFRYALEDEMSNESIEKVDKVLVDLGLMSPVNKKPETIKKEDVESWQWINDH